MKRTLRATAYAVIGRDGIAVETIAKTRTGAMQNYLLSHGVAAATPIDRAQPGAPVGDDVVVTLFAANARPGDAVGHVTISA
jgi:hypothetical protein